MPPPHNDAWLGHSTKVARDRTASIYAEVHHLTDLLELRQKDAARVLPSLSAPPRGVPPGFCSSGFHVGEHMEEKSSSNEDLGSRPSRVTSFDGGEATAAWPAPALSGAPNGRTPATNPRRPHLSGSGYSRGSVRGDSSRPGAEVSARPLPCATRCSSLEADPAGEPGPRDPSASTHPRFARRPQTFA